MSDLQHDYTHEPVCPYCGRVYGDAWEINFGGDMEGSTEITCGACEKDFSVDRHVEVTYSTTPLSEVP